MPALAHCKNCICNQINCKIVHGAQGQLDRLFLEILWLPRLFWGETRKKYGLHYLLCPTLLQQSTWHNTYKVHITREVTFHPRPRRRAPKQTTASSTALLTPFLHSCLLFFQSHFGASLEWHGTYSIEQHSSHSGLTPPAFPQTQWQAQ